jgi:hypothetical protein
VAFDEVEYTGMKQHHLCDYVFKEEERAIRRRESRTAGVAVIVKSRPQSAMPASGEGSSPGMEE